MCNLICRILVLLAYSSPIIYGDAVIRLLPHCLLPPSHDPAPSDTNADACDGDNL